ncbi:DoxX-like family protein [Paenibacillus gansuensis]|uniref:DoxX-like family protein n=1 Tax=Paenibacillus gansuensis TaxID=306542 RepID=A0ABW5P7P3_9BACL
MKDNKWDPFTIVHYLAVGFLVLVWLYVGIVPKLLFPDSGEIALMQKTGMFPGKEAFLVTVLGGAEAAWGIILAVLHRSRRVHLLNIIGLLLLLLAGLGSSRDMLQAPFNPITLTVPMLGLALIGWVTAGGRKEI